MSKKRNPKVSDLGDMVRRVVPGLRHKDGTGNIIIESDSRIPHQSQWIGICLEIAMKRPEKSYKRFFWTTMANRIKSAQQFQFGHVEDIRIKEEAIRAGPLIGDGHLSLPYQSVIYNYTLIPDPKDVPPEIANDRVSFSTLACLMEKKELKNVLPGPFILAADFIFVPPQALDAKRKFCMILAGGCAFQANPPEGRWIGDVVDEPGQVRRETLVSVADGVASLSMILATRGVETEVRQPNDKLQKARIKRGKPLLPRITHVNTEKYYKAMENVEKGHHASPVPHLRRGHIRRLGEDRTTWVRDTIVNCRTLSDSKGRDHYEVE